MSTAIATIAPVSHEQLDLIRRTVAAGATNDELSLFLHDCERRNVHPLDKLLYFTKRKGKYTPITSIDFFRSQAGDTGQHAGTDDAIFVDGDKYPVSGTVTVYRMVEGIRCPYTATARWAEYYPGDGDLGFMYRKMPHTMLGKCAEALALRKAFPKQLAGLYTSDEMAQAGAPDNHRQPVPMPQAIRNELIEVASEPAKPRLKHSPEPAPPIARETHESSEKPADSSPQTVESDRPPDELGDYVDATVGAPPIDLPAWKEWIIRKPDPDVFNEVMPDVRTLPSGRGKDQLMGMLSGYVRSNGWTFAGLVAHESPEVWLATNPGIDEVNEYCKCELSAIDDGDEKRRVWNLISDYSHGDGRAWVFGKTSKKFYPPDGGAA